VVVEGFACRRRGWNHIRAGDYEVLHRRLLRACRSLADTGGKARQAYYQGLEALAKPWLTTRVLEQADRDILLQLLACCRREDRELGGGDRWRHIARRSVTWGLAAAAAAGGVILLARADGLFWSAAYYARDTGGLLRWAVRQSSEVERWYAGGLVVVLIAMLLVWRSARG
jgi:hypothetical protein